MTLGRCITWLLVGRHFILTFGVIYVISLIFLQRMMSTVYEHSVGGERKSVKLGKASLAGAVTADKAQPFIKPTEKDGKILGIITGDVYMDKEFRSMQEFSFRSDDTVIAVKTHHPFADNSNNLDPRVPPQPSWKRVIILVRHPLDAIIAVFNYGHSRAIHTRKADLNQFIKSDGKPTKKWNKFVHGQIQSWGRCLRDWLNTFKGPKLIIFYEDLQIDMKESLIAMNQFLGLQLNKTRLRCTLEYSSHENFHRKEHHDKRLLYDTSMLNEAEKVLEGVHKLISTNYTHIRPGFRIPPNYAVSLIRENFSMKP